MHDLIEKSKKIREDAQKLLVKNKIIEILSKYGRVELTGSYAYDLMLNNEDIDIYVISKDVSRKKALKIHDELISKTKLLGYMFYDWVSFRDKKFPVGYYVGINSLVPGYKQQWKIDIWLIKEKPKFALKYEKMFSQKIKRGQKFVILNFKQKIREKKLKIPSNLVYDAVMVKKITNWDDFVKS